MEVYSAQKSNKLTKLIPFQKLYRLSENIHRNISQIPPAPPPHKKKAWLKLQLKEAIVYYFPEGQEVFRKMWGTKNSPTHLEKKKKKETKSHQEARAHKSPDHTKTVPPWR